MKIPFLIAAVAAMHCLPSWADTYSFAAVKDAGVSASDVLQAQYNYTDAAFLSNTGLASASGNGNAAKAQALPGVNRIEVANTVPVTDEFIRQTGIGGPFAIALSAWTDNFLITGGTGSGTVKISANVTGRFGQGYGSGGGYGLWLSTPDELRTEVTEFLSTDPTAWLLETIDEPEDGGETLMLSYLANVLKPGHTDPGLLVAPGSQFGGVFTTEVPFTYGESFSIASVLFGFANDTGSLSAMNSAHFGISVLNNAGAIVTTGSGMVYTAAVPEPQTQAMLLAGLAVLAFTALRRSSSWPVPMPATQKHGQTPD
ncbi:PEP-CTERM sorting domain-containing protein [Aquabacterium sp. CECT 9606]|uniref:PEP-CTERM sorting domain-containing protein n=1 Tax=Aquabacterium sp. CECT 9606 TaxID=2845822 RepID=UPI001E539109|nr:PEP-CTERM sorting domain-containing protein [Aquabacterium sp. CECT 9606]CAH0352517.1 hypothetical protein AQB9606_02678 [Aquabacterium sp. CECT 9606]